MTIEDLEALIADAPSRPWEQHAHANPRGRAAMDAIVAVWNEAPSLIAKIRELEVSLGGSREAHAQTVETARSELAALRDEWSAYIADLVKQLDGSRAQRDMYFTALNDAVSLLEIYNHYSEPHPTLVRLRALLAAD